MLKCILQTSSLLRHIAFATIKRVPPSGENKPTTVGHYILRLFFIGELHNHLLQESSHNVLSVQEKGGGDIALSHKYMLSDSSRNIVNNYWDIYQFGCGFTIKIAYIFMW